MLCLGCLMCEAGGRCAFSSHCRRRGARRNGADLLGRVGQRRGGADENVRPWRSPSGPLAREGRRPASRRAGATLRLEQQRQAVEQMPAAASNERPAATGQPPASNHGVLRGHLCGEHPRRVGCLEWGGELGPRWLRRIQDGAIMQNSADACRCNKQSKRLGCKPWFRALVTWHTPCCFERQLRVGPCWVVPASPQPSLAFGIYVLPRCCHIWILLSTPRLS